MILYHITSLEKPIQSILIPKIPDETEIGENYTEKRICLAPSILECLKSAEIVNTTFNRHNWLFIPILMC